MTNTYRIVLADDHALFRGNLRKILDGEPGFEVVGEAGDGLDLLALLGAVRPQMAIVDISMPRLGGIEAVREMRRTNPEIKVLVMTMHEDRSYIRQAISAGAEGYLLKDDIDRELFSAIARIRRGDVSFPPLFP